MSAVEWWVVGGFVVLIVSLYLYLGLSLRKGQVGLSQAALDCADSCDELANIYGEEGDDTRAKIMSAIAGDWRKQAERHRRKAWPFKVPPEESDETS